MKILLKTARCLLPLAVMASLGGCVSISQILFDYQPGNRPLSVTLKDGSVQRYMEYVPPGAPKDENLPLIVFLHGSNEAGGDTYSVLANGPWDYAATHTKNPQDFPFIVIAPQMDKDGEWDPAKLNDWLSQVEATLPVDRRRIYLTGLSRGGQGTWDFAMRYPHYFAAIAPIAAYSDVDQPCRLKGIPVWVFHGADDPTVPLAGDQALVDAAQACGVKVKFTVYPHTGHDAWTETYHNPDFYAWLLKHKKPLFRLPALFHTAPSIPTVPPQP